MLKGVHFGRIDQHKRRQLPGFLAVFLDSLRADGLLRDAEIVVGISEGTGMLRLAKPYWLRCHCVVLILDPHGTSHP